MVKFENVSKKFGSTLALDDLSFEIEQGEFVFITGPSGAGKSTMLKLLLRQLRPDKGRVLIDGKDIADLKRKEIPYYRRKLGFVFQDFKLLQDRTVYENVSLGLEIGEEIKESRDKKIKEALKKVDILDKADLFPRQLAGGEQQRAVVARALVTDPKIILADEPTGNLDPVTSKQIVTLLDEAAKSGTTVLMATHNENLVNTFKRRVLHFKKGKLVSDAKSGKYEED
jgi:cell division transport system ATP-binding protein